MERRDGVDWLSLREISSVLYSKASLQLHEIIRNHRDKWVQLHKAVYPLLPAPVIGTSDAAGLKRKIDAAVVQDPDGGRPAMV